MAEFARISTTTIEDFVTGYEDATMRDRILLNRLQAAGQVKYGKGGLGVDWGAKKTVRALVTNNGTQPFDFPQSNLYKRAFVTYIGYAMTDAIFKRHKLMNQTKQGIIKLWADVFKDISSDFTDRFAPKLYIDSNATGNSEDLSGIETMTGGATQTYTYNASTPTARTANAADPIGVPVRSYAGLSCVPGALGGAWTGAWPEGSGDSDFDFWSPLIVNYTSTWFDGAGDSWADNAELAVTHGLDMAARNRASAGDIDLVLLDRPLWSKFKAKQLVKERTTINQGSDKRDFGMEPRKAFYYDGAEIATEFGMPANVGYGFNLKMMELWSMQKKLFSFDTWEDKDLNADKAKIDFLGQFKFVSPRNFVKWQALA